MADRTHGPFPTPPSVRDSIESEIHDVADPQLRYRIRRLASWCYVEGYAEGHMHGAFEVHADERAKRDGNAARS